MSGYGWKDFIDSKLVVHAERTDWAKMVKMLKTALITDCYGHALSLWPEYGNGYFYVSLHHELVDGRAHCYPCAEFRNIVPYTFKDFLQGDCAIHVDEKDWTAFSGRLKAANISNITGLGLDQWPRYGNGSNGKFRTVGTSLVGSFSDGISVVEFRDVFPDTLDDFIAGKITIRFSKENTQEEWDEFVALMEPHNIAWCSGASLHGSPITSFSNVYTVGLDGKWSTGLSHSWEREGRRIVNFRDIVPKKEEKPMNTFQSFLDEKISLRVSADAWPKFAKLADAAGILWCSGSKASGLDLSPCTVSIENKTVMTCGWEYQGRPVFSFDNIIMSTMPVGYSFADFMAGKIRLQIEDKVEWELFAKHADENGILWNSGDKPAEYTRFNLPGFFRIWDNGCMVKAEIGIPEQFCKFKDLSDYSTIKEGHPTFEDFLSEQIAVRVTASEWPVMAKMCKDAGRWFNFSGNDHVPFGIKREGVALVWCDPEEDNGLDAGFNNFPTKLPIVDFCKLMSPAVATPVKPAAVPVQKYSIKDFADGKVCVRVTKDQWPAMGKLCSGICRDGNFNDVLARLMREDGVALVWADDDWGDMEMHVRKRPEDEDGPIINFAELVGQAAPQKRSFESFIKEEFAVRCDTKAEFDTLMVALEKRGYSWCSGCKPTKFHGNGYPIYIEFCDKHIAKTEACDLSYARPVRIPLSELDLPSAPECASKRHTFQDFRSGKIAVRCGTIEQSKVFLQACEDAGMEWRSGAKPTEHVNRCIPVKLTSYQDTIAFKSDTQPLDDLIPLIEFSDVDMPSVSKPNTFEDFKGGKIRLKVKKSEWSSFALNCAVAGIQWKVGSIAEYVPPFMDRDYIYVGCESTGFSYGKMFWSRNDTAPNTPNINFADIDVPALHLEYKFDGVRTTVQIMDGASVMKSASVSCHRDDDYKVEAGIKYATEKLFQNN